MSIKQQVEYWDDVASVGADASVIDPRDSLGCKNAYIGEIRNSEILSELEASSDLHTVLDFGCGSGSISIHLGAKDYEVVGLDISQKLLEHAVKRSSGKDVFVRFDGRRIPLNENSVDAITTFSVLNYFSDDDELVEILSEFHRVLKPGGKVIAIEQIKSRDGSVDDTGKRQRSPQSFIEFFCQVGFIVEKSQVIRSGHFPLLYLIRLGFVPSALFSKISFLEKWMFKKRKCPRFDYADNKFVLLKK